MNKEEFVNELSNQLSYSKDKCLIINEILESNFFLNKKNNDQIIEELIQKLSINQEEATKIYNIAIKIIKNEAKNKLKHPFKSKD